MQDVWRQLRREPLLQFLVLGTAVYLIYRALAPLPADTIVVTEETLRAVQQGAADLVGRELTAAEGKEAIEAYIDDEVLLREAARRGYDKSDYRTRKRLLTVMRYTLDEQIPEPSRAQLEAYFRENAERFDSGVAVSFDQVAFATGSDNMPDDPAAFRDRLAAGADFSRLGDRGYLYPPPTFTDATPSRVAADFGPGIYDRLLTAPFGTWIGPLETRSGLVFVRATARRPLPPPTFEEVAGYLRQDYNFQRRRQIQAEKVEELRRKYRVVIEETSSP